MLSNKEKKRLYDIKYRRKNTKRIKIRDKKYNESLAGRAMQKRSRDKRKDKHLEYCRQPDYREWKKEYDKPYRFKKLYGEYWECMIIVDNIHKEVLKLVPDKYERDKMRGTIKRMMVKIALKRSILNGWNFNY